jgi:hypothetical protein
MRDPGRRSFYPPPPVYPQPGKRSKCVRCRYPLKGLDGRRRCPECGLPIADSLRTADPLTPAPFKRLERWGFVVAALFWAGLLTAAVIIYKAF